MPSASNKPSKIVRADFTQLPSKGGLHSKQEKANESARTAAENIVRQSSPTIAQAAQQATSMEKSFFHSIETAMELDKHIKANKGFLSSSACSTQRLNQASVISSAPQEPLDITTTTGSTKRVCSSSASTYLNYSEQSEPARKLVKMSDINPIFWPPSDEDV